MREAGRRIFEPSNRGLYQNLSTLWTVCGTYLREKLPNGTTVDVVATKSGESVCCQCLAKIPTETSLLSLTTLSKGTEVEEWYTHDIAREGARVNFWDGESPRCFTFELVYGNGAIYIALHLTLHNV